MGWPRPTPIASGSPTLYATPAREAELAAIFMEATRLEADFWEMGWRVGRRVGQ